MEESHQEATEKEVERILGYLQSFFREERKYSSKTLPMQKLNRSITSSYPHSCKWGRKVVPFPFPEWNCCRSPHCCVQLQFASRYPQSGKLPTTLAQVALAPAVFVDAVNLLPSKSLNVSCHSAVSSPWDCNENSIGSSLSLVDIHQAEIANRKQ